MSTEIHFSGIKNHIMLFRVVLYLGQGFYVSI